MAFYTKFLPSTKNACRKTLSFVVQPYTVRYQGNPRSQLLFLILRYTVSLWAMDFHGHVKNLQLGHLNNIASMSLIA